MSGGNVSPPAQSGEGTAAVSIGNLQRQRQGMTSAGSNGNLHLTRANASGGNVSPPAQSGEGTAAVSIGNLQRQRQKLESQDLMEIFI